VEATCCVCKLEFNLPTLPTVPTEPHTLLVHLLGPAPPPPLPPPQPAGCARSRGAPRMRGRTGSVGGRVWGMRRRWRARRQPWRRGAPWGGSWRRSRPHARQSGRRWSGGWWGRGGGGGGPLPACALPSLSTPTCFPLLARPPLQALHSFVHLVSALPGPDPSSLHLSTPPSLHTAPGW
jgi:hypothetical protein